MLSTSIPTSELLGGSSRKQTDNVVLSSNQPPYYPYLQSPRTFPAPDNLTNPMGPAFYPQLAVSSIANVTIYDLVYAVNVSGVGSVVEMATGTYNATLAQTIFTTRGCTNATCTNHLPILWNAPTPIAVFGGTMIQADTIATWSDCVAVAATVGGSTSLFLADNYGASNWSAITGPNPIPGGSPHLLMQNGTILLTTLSPRLRATEFGNLCPTEIPSWHSPGIVIHPGGLPSPPSVTAVIPYQATAGTQVLVNGSNLNGATQVLVGGASASFHYSGSQLWVTIPSGAGGPVPLIVTTSGGFNQVTCASQFQYGATLPTGTPQIEMLAPAGGKAGTTVTVNGVYFTPTSKVFFGATQATSSYVSQGVMHATSPSGLTGTLNVTVQNSVGVSPQTCADLYDYQPVVTGLIAAGGSSGNTVSIYGSFFTSSSTVKFGGTPSAKVVYVSSTQLKAKAPTGSGAAHVTVIQGATASSTTCADKFTYEMTPPAGEPQVLSVSPATATVGSSVTLTGVNFTGNLSVTFGGIPVYVASQSATSVKVIAPMGNGTVPIQVANKAGASLSVCEDLFNIQLPAALPYTTEFQATLGGTLSDAPVAISPNNYGIVAANMSTSSIYYYSPATTGFSFTSHTVLALNNSTGSKIFNRLGGTLLTVPDSAPGQVAASSSGTNLFVIYTTNAGGATVGRTLVSGNSGSSWQGPYQFESQTGSTIDPDVVIGQTGYAYASWVNAQGTSWAVDQAVFAASGRIISNSLAQSVYSNSNYSTDQYQVTGSLESSNLTTASASLILDPFQRPLVAWSAPGPNWSSVFYTGGFVTPATELSVLRAGFNDTHYPADFQNFGWTNITKFMGQVNATFANLSTNLTGWLLCKSLRAAAGQVYPNVTTIVPSLAFPGPPVSSCSVKIGAKHNSFLNAADVGPLSANVYLSVESQVLLESIGVGTLPNPSWSWIPGNSGFGSYNGTVNSSATYLGMTFSVQPITLNPNTVWLRVTSYVPAVTGGTILSYSSGGSSCGYAQVERVNWNFWTNVTVPVTNATSMAFPSGPSGLPSPYLVKLAAWQNGNWSVKLSFESQTFVTTHINPQCLTNGTYGSGGYTNQSHSAPSWTSETLRGNFTTGIGLFNPGGMVLNVKATTGAAGNDWMFWNNTMWAGAEAWLNNSASSPSVRNWTDGNLQVPEFASGGQWNNVQVENTSQYVATALAESSAGSINSAWAPLFNTTQVWGPSPAIHASWSCSYSQNTTGITPPTWNSPTSSVAPNITITSPTSATIIWFSAQPGAGWVSAVESPDNATILQAATMIQSGTHFEFSAQLHGLDAWGLYRVLLHETVRYGCVVFHYGMLWSTGWNLQLPATFQLAEKDLPYDSITQEGGGAQIFWPVPYNFTKISTYVNGAFLCYPKTNSSAVVTIPLTSLSPAVGESSSWSGGGASTTYQLNVSAGLIPNTIYIAKMFLNYTEPAWGATLNVTAISQPFSFYYLKDTTGDGLSDSEKAQGWNVTLDDGKYNNATHGTVNAWATNGLVNDFVEKEYGLNAMALDSAQSHMLDTWNLTFLLGNSSTRPSCPAEFLCWGENTTDPFNYSQSPNQAAVGWSGYHTNTTGGLHDPVEDSSPYDAAVLWKNVGTGSGNSALAYLQSLIAKESPSDSLRAVIGCLWLGHAGGCSGSGASNPWTLTVWGKLSWGADPLSVSTPRDGIPDGMRLDPLGDTYLNVTVNGFNESTGYSTNGSGVGVFVKATSSAAPYFPTGQTDYSSYMQNTTSIGTSMIWTGMLPVNFPVVSTEQYAHLNFSLLDAASAGMTWKNTSSITADLLNPVTQNPPLCGRGYCLSVLYHPITVLSKANTIFIVSGDNSTLSTLPVGLQRYVGEQDFVLLEVNSTFSGTGYVYPYVNTSNPGDISSSTYHVQLAVGMNNIVVPRSLFVQSPLGQTLLMNQTNSSVLTANESIHQTSSNGIYLQSGSVHFWDPSTWQARIQGLASWNGSDFASGTPSHPGFIKLYSNSNQSCSVGSECGGVAANPSIEARAPSFAVGAIFAINLSLADDNWSGLLDGLLMSPSGNFTNWAFGATASLPSLGITSTVLNGLANPTLFNEGRYLKPKYHPPAPSPTSWQSAGSSVWNVVSGTFGPYVSVAWGAASAAGAFITYIAGKVWTWGLGAVSQAAAALKTIAAAIVSLLDELASIILALISGMFADAIQSFAHGVTSASGELVATLFKATGYSDNYYLSGNSNYRAQNASAASSAYGSGIVPTLATFGVLSFVGFAVLAVATPIDIGTGVIVGLLIAAILAAFAISGLGTTMGLPNASLSILGTTYGYFSSVAETIFNLTEYPLNSSTATAIAVPDGDPDAAVADLAALIGWLSASFYAIAAIGSNKWVAPLQKAIAWEMGFGAMAVATIDEISSEGLPSSCPNATVRQEYQSSANLATIVLTFTVASLLASFAAWYTTKSLDIETGIALAVGFIGLAFGIGEINHAHDVCGVY
jgi:hypothetical protein